MSEKCTPCEQAANEILILSRNRAINEAIKKGKELGVPLMAVGICAGEKERYIYCIPEDAGQLKRVEYISILQ